MPKSKAHVSWDNVRKAEETELETVVTSKGDEDEKHAIKGFGFEDDRDKVLGWWHEESFEVQ